MGVLRPWWQQAQGDSGPTSALAPAALAGQGVGHGIGSAAVGGEPALRLLQPGQARAAAAAATAELGQGRSGGVLVPVAVTGAEACQRPPASVPPGAGAGADPRAVGGRPTAQPGQLRPVAHRPAAGGAAGSGCPAGPPGDRAGVPAGVPAGTSGAASPRERREPRWTRGLHRQRPSDAASQRHNNTVILRDHDDCRSFWCGIRTL